MLWNFCKWSQFTWVAPADGSWVSTQDFTIYAPNVLSFVVVANIVNQGQTKQELIMGFVIFPPPEPSLWNLQELSLVMESVWGGDIICSSWWKSAFVMKMLPTFLGSFFVHCNAIAENFWVWIDCLSKYWDNCDHLMKVEVLMKIIRTQSKFLGEILLFSEKYFLAKTDTFQY